MIPVNQAGAPIGEIPFTRTGLLGFVGPVSHKYMLTVSFLKIDWRNTAGVSSVSRAEWTCLHRAVWCLLWGRSRGCWWWAVAATTLTIWWPQRWPWSLSKQFTGGGETLMSSNGAWMATQLNFFYIALHTQHSRSKCTTKEEFEQCMCLYTQLWFAYILLENNKASCICLKTEQSL